MDKIQEVYEQYRKSFVEKLYIKFDELDIIEKLLYENNKDIEIIKQFYQLIHSMSGNSGIMGYTELCHTGLELEAYLNEIIKSNMAVDLDTEKISFFTAELRAIFSEIAKPSKE